MQTDPQTAQTVQSAYKALVEFGVIGAVLAVVLGSAIALVWWLMMTQNATLREKDALINEIQELRVEAATLKIKAITENPRISEKILDALEKQIQTREGN